MTALSFLTAGLILIGNVVCMGFAANTILRSVVKTNIVRYSTVPVLGIVTYGMYLFLTGYFIGMNRLVMALPLLLMFVYMRRIKELSGAAESFITQFFAQKKFIFFYACIFIISVITFLRLFGTRILSDSLVYHLYLPKEYIAAGRIFRVPFSEHALWPQLVEMFAAFGMVFDGIAAAKLISFLAYAGIGFFVFIIVRAMTDNALHAVLSAVIVIATPAYFFYAADIYADLTITLFTAACVYFLYRYFTGQQKADLIVAAVACAGALSCKYTSIMVLTSALAVIAFNSGRDRRLRDILIFIVVTTLFCSHWYVWSYIESGNPIFPFGHNLFGKGFLPHVKPGEMSLFGRLISAGTGRATGAGNGIVNFLMLPFDVTFRSNLFGGAKIGYIYLALFPLFVYAFFIKGRHRMLIAFIMLYTVQWFFMGQYTRYLFPILPLYAAVSLTALNEVWARQWIRIIFFTITAILLAIQTAWSGYYFYQDFEHIFKGAAREEYLDPSYRLGKFLTANTAGKGRILLIGEDRLFYLPSNSIRERTFRNFTHYESDNNRMGILKKNGIDYVLINRVVEGADETGFDAQGYFLGEVGRALDIIANYNKEGRDFVLCVVR